MIDERAVNIAGNKLGYPRAVIEKIVTAYLTYAGEGAVPVGWQLVPTKHAGSDGAILAGLTWEMHDAFWGAYKLSIEKHGSFESTNAGYNAMLAAAPPHPRQDGAREGEARVEEVECISYERGYREPAEPIWRVLIGPEGQEVCFDFDDRRDADRLCEILNTRTTPPAPDEAVEAEPKVYRKHTRPAREMTDEQIAAEITELEAKWDDFRANCEGHSGSPGEWIVERLDELDTAQKRRARSRRDVGGGE